MRVSARLLVAGATALALGVLLLAAAGPGSAAGDKPLVWKPVIPQEDADDVVKYLGELTQQALAKGPPTGDDEKKDWNDKVKNTGLLVAAITQSAKGGDSDQLAAARAAGLQLSQAVDKEAWDAAKTQAAALASLKAGARGSESFDAEKTDLADLMNLLRLRGKGGLGFGVKPPAGSANTDGIEAKLIGLSKRPLPAGEMARQSDDLVRSAYILVAIGEFTDGHTPKKKGATGKGAKEWTEWTEDMRSAALDLADAAKKKNPAAVKTAVNKLSSSCNNCHGEFRDQ